MALSLFRVLVIPAAVAFLVGAGEPPDKKDEKKKDKPDPQATFEPRSKPGDGQKFLAKFVGDWEVAKTVHLSTGEVVKMKGECRQAMIHEGRFLKSDFTFEDDGAKITGTGLIGFEPQTGAFTSVWLDSRQTRMSLRQSEGKFEGTEIVLFGKSLGGGAKGGGRSKTVTKLEEDGNRIVHRQFAVSPEGKERMVMELVLKKKAATPGK